MSSGSPSKIHVFTHGDLDGLTSAAVYLRALERSEAREEVRLHFAEPYSLHRAMRGALGSSTPALVAIMDLGANPGTFGQVLLLLSKLRASGTRVEWYDHHLWEEEHLEKLRSLGVEVKVDLSTCTAGVVARSLAERGELGEDDCVWQLVEATCSADTWSWTSPLSPFLYRVVGTRRGPAGDSWKRALLGELAECRIWSDDLSEVAEANLNAELGSYGAEAVAAKVLELPGGLKAAYLVRRRAQPPTSLLASYIISRTGSDLVALGRLSGSISFRSRSKSVRCVASCFGGGGHASAAGARVNVPVYIRLLGLLASRVEGWWLERRLRKLLLKCASECLPELLSS
ncbi:MAG: hypothetical protein QXU97_00130 [Fervidicoccaceae archaeon]